MKEEKKKCTKNINIKKSTSIKFSIEEQKPKNAASSPHLELLCLHTSWQKDEKSMGLKKISSLLQSTDRYAPFPHGPILNDNAEKGKANCDTMRVGGCRHCTFISDLYSANGTKAETKDGKFPGSMPEHTEKSKFMDGGY